MRIAPHSQVEFAGVGFYVPEKRLTNDDLARMVDTSDEWITPRTGIKERRIAAPDQASSDLGYEASVKALAAAGVEADELDLIICATCTPDHAFPSTACVLQHKLGAVNAAGYDLSAACSGFLYGCIQAAGLIQAGMCRNVLVVGAECISKVTDYTDRGSCILFGDGAGAVVLRPSSEPSRELLWAEMGADGSRPEILLIPAGGSRMPASPETVQARQHYIELQGREVFKLAVAKLIELIKRIPKKCGIPLSDIDLVIPHQSNMRIIETSCRRAGIEFEKAYANIDRYGNSSAASIPIAMTEAIEEGRLKRGDLVLMLAFGGGVTWASYLFRF